MKLIFKEAGKYRNGRFVTVVTDEDVKAGNAIEVATENALEYINAELAVEAKKAEAKKPAPAKSVPKKEAKESKK